MTLLEDMARAISYKQQELRLGQVETKWHEMNDKYKAERIAIAVEALKVLFNSSSQEDIYTRAIKFFGMHQSKADILEKPFQFICHDIMCAGLEKIKREGFD